MLRQQQCLDGVGEALGVVAARRVPPTEPAAAGLGHRFVDGNPPVDQVTEGLRRPVNVASPEVRAGSTVEESALVVGEPAGRRDVLQAHPVRHAEVPSGHELVPGSVDRVVVVAAGSWLEA